MRRPHRKPKLIALVAAVVTLGGTSVLATAGGGVGGGTGDKPVKIAQGWTPSADGR